MAKNKKQASKTPKKHSSKYSKLAAVCSKELAAKKAALVRAEKALAKAQKTHTELLAEVARLDMLDRSLKALINGTEPPQNVRYVYTYPQWVWWGNPYGWYWNGYTWTVTLNGQNSLQGNTVTVPNTWTYNTSGQYQNSLNLNTSVPVVTTTTTGALTSGASSAYTLTSSNAGSLISNSSGITLDSNGSIPAGNNSFTFNNVSSSIPSGTSGQPELTIDLSTGASDPDAVECKGDCEPACEKCAVSEPEAKPVGVGG